MLVLFHIFKATCVDFKTATKRHKVRRNSKKKKIKKDSWTSSKLSQKNKRNLEPNSSKNYCTSVHFVKDMRAC